VLPRLSPVALDNLLHGAHVVDGIVKGLKTPGWPANGWQALHKLAMDLALAVSPGASPSHPGGGLGRGQPRHGASPPRTSPHRGRG
jgi:DNA polymerase-3 subunit delta